MIRVDGCCLIVVLEFGDVGSLVGFVWDPIQPESRTLGFLNRDEWPPTAGDVPGEETNDWTPNQTFWTRPATMTVSCPDPQDASMHGY